MKMLIIIEKNVSSGIANIYMKTQMLQAYLHSIWFWTTVDSFQMMKTFLLQWVQHQLGAFINDVTQIWAFQKNPPSQLC